MSKCPTGLDYAYKSDNCISASFFNKSHQLLINEDIALDPRDPYDLARIKDIFYEPSDNIHDALKLMETEETGWFYSDYEPIPPEITPLPGSIVQIF